MRAVFVGSGDECTGFSLVGVETVKAETAEEFKEKVRQLIENEGVGVLIVADRFAEEFIESFGEEMRKRGRPAVVFVPSIDGIHYKKSLKEFLYRVLGV